MTEHSKIYWRYNAVATVAFVAGAIAVIGLAVGGIWGDPYVVKWAGSFLAAAIVVFTTAVIFGLLSDKP